MEELLKKTMNTPIVGGVQMGHQHLQPKNHASKGMGKSMELGGGGRFATLKNKLSQQKGVTNPAGLAAAIGRKKFGAKKMASMAMKGK